MGQIIKITESQLKNVLKSIITEQQYYPSSLGNPYDRAKQYGMNLKPQPKQQKLFGGGEFGGAGAGGEWGDEPKTTKEPEVKPVIIPPVVTPPQCKRRNENFPLKLWDLSSKVAVIQKGMNLPRRQQIGCFGNITLNKIKQDIGLDVRNGIDEPTYNKILKFYGIDSQGNTIQSPRGSTEDDYLNQVNPIQPKTAQLQTPTQKLMTRR